MRASSPAGDKGDAIEPALRACFGVACPVHGRCARYAAVTRSPADPHTMVTCQRGSDFPLFLQSADAAAANDGSTTHLPEGQPPS